MDTASAARVLTVWLGMIGYQQDRHGNFKRPPIDTERYHFSDRMLQRQFRYEGTWHNRTSTPLLDAVDTLIRNSAKTIRDIYSSASVIVDMMLEGQPPADVHAAAQEILATMSRPRAPETPGDAPQPADPGQRAALEQIFSALFAPQVNLEQMASWIHGRLDALGEAAEERKAKRKAASESRREKAARRELEHKAVILANKQLAFEHPDVVLSTFTGRLDPPTGERFRAEQTRLTAVWAEELTRGTTVFPSFASVARPPLLPIRIHDSVYRWVEQEGGVDYTTSFENGGADTMKIVVGSTGGFMSINPVTHRPIMQPYDSVGDGYLGGAVALTPTGLVARLFLVMVQKPRTGAGTRLLSLWCKLMNAYGIRAWVAEAIGEEGEAFLQAMQRRGAISIVEDRGAYKLVRCT
jgi:hypothetical protein